MTDLLDFEIDPDDPELVEAYDDFTFWSLRLTVPAAYVEGVARAEDGS